MSHQAGAPLPVRPEEWRVLRTSRANVLIAGTPALVATVLSELGDVLREPIALWWPGTPLHSILPASGGTLVLHDVEALACADQRQLAEWLRKHGNASRIVSTTSVRLFSEVQQGRFDPALYYTLNVVYLDSLEDDRAIISS